MRLSDEKFNWLKHNILNKLLRYDAWENVYIPYDKVLLCVPRHCKGVAKQVVVQLVKEGFLLLHKNNTCLSLNSKRMVEICFYERIKKKSNV